MKFQLLIVCLLTSCGLYCMDDKDEGDKINLLKAIAYVNSNNKNDEIVICRLHLKNPEGHIAAKSNCRERHSSDSYALDAQMRGILSDSVGNIRGLELWEWTKPACTADNLEKPLFIVYAVVPTEERNEATQAAIRVFKERKKPFVIAVRKNADDVLVRQLKKYLPETELVFFPQEQQPGNYFYPFLIFSSISVFIGFLCFLKWGR